MSFYMSWIFSFKIFKPWVNLDKFLFIIYSLKALDIGNEFANHLMNVHNWKFFHTGTYYLNLSNLYSSVARNIEQ